MVDATHLSIPGLDFLRRGKVRDLYAFGEHLLLVASDRVSAFDVILPNVLPGKGMILTAISTWWFQQLAGFCRNHLVETDVDRIDGLTDGQRAALRHRAVLVRKHEILPFEFVVRGYLTGSGWKSYRQDGTVCGVKLPDGLLDGSKLPEPIFTPTTKAKQDVPVTFEDMANVIGTERAHTLRDLALRIYRAGCERAEPAGILIADTKFEFAWDQDAPVLVDEVLTPDSSRFWPMDSWQPGVTPPSYDKQIVRNHLLTLDWNFRAPGPVLPDEIVSRTMERYFELYEKLTGRSAAFAR